MALITCPECGKKVSDKAEICVGCGYPIAKLYVPEVENKKSDSVLCPYCGENILDADEYCDACGMRIKEFENKKNNSTKNAFNAMQIEPSEPYTTCPECHGYNVAGEFTCKHCGHKYTMGEYKVIVPEENEIYETHDLKFQDSYRKGGIFTKIKCPSCWSIEFEVIDTKKKFSLGKAFVGNTIGGAVLGPAGAIAGTFQGVNGKNGKTRFLCRNCGKVWEQKV